MDACSEGKLSAEVAAVVSNRMKAYGLMRTYEAGLPSVVLPIGKAQERCEYDRQLAGIVKHFQPDWIILAGWMRMLSNVFIAQFPNRIVNLHPALPGMFPGLHAIERAYQASCMGKINYTGLMVHLVTDEGMDDGPLLNRRVVDIENGDTLEMLEEKIHAAEHDAIAGGNNPKFDKPGTRKDTSKCQKLFSQSMIKAAWLILLAVWLCWDGN